MTTLGPYELNTIITGDARELAKAIPDESVDLIFTDPVYDRIEDYRWLAETAARVLKPGGNLVAQSGSVHRYDCETAMRNREELLPMPLLAEVFPFARSPLYKYKTNMRWKPYLWFSKGDRCGGWILSAHIGNKGMGRQRNGRPVSKVYFEWGDSNSFFLEYIKQLSNNDSVILDPFTGGGTVPAVCKMLQRDYLAFEIDPDTADMARQRVAETQPPLPLVMPEQMELI